MELALREAKALSGIRAPVPDAVSIWEMRLKHNAPHASGARKNRFDPKDAVAVLEGQDVTFLPMTPNHAARALDAPLLVQAQEEGLKLLTADRRLAGHPLAVTLHGGA